MNPSITIDGTRFRDRHGRHTLLRGVNLGGDCKLPFAPDGHSWRPTDFADHRTVSFVGRPAPLDELDGHLARIARWGFNCLRLLTTWEAVEHAGPGEYDEAYLDYFAQICRRAAAHGLTVFIDFHQDVWSRMSGGDGAPGWTWEAAGLDFTRFDAADAAHVMQYRYDPAEGGRQDSYPQMSWGANYRMPANGIMWTLFFASEDFAPSARVGGENVQTYLQRHYLGAMRAVAERVRDNDAVIGFDSLNEPGSGWIGQSMEKRAGLSGLAWSPLDALAAASGNSRTLPRIAFGRGEVGTEVVNAGRVSIWLPGRDDPFRAAGAWSVHDGEPIAADPAYFQRIGVRTVDLERDYMLPFFHRVADTVRAVRADWLLFAELDPFGATTGHGFPEGMPARTVNASHWYDLATLVTKRFDGERSVNVFTGATREGPKAIEQGYADELARTAAHAMTLPGGAPTLIGEFGIPYDLNGAEAYAAWAGGDRSPEVWAKHVLALDLTYNALDRQLLSSTQWNYTVSNANDPMIGDGWNQEDLSIWSADQADGTDGGRAVRGFSRAWVRRAQGDLVAQRYDLAAGRLEAEIDVDFAITEPTELFVPHDAMWRVECDDPQAVVSSAGSAWHILSRRAGPLRLTGVATTDAQA